MLLNKVCGFSGIAEHEHSDKVFDWENGGSLRSNSKGHIEDFQCFASNLIEQRQKNIPIKDVTNAKVFNKYWL